jgi:hypothetical protein
VILADNASTDGSPAWVRERFPDVQVHENGGNLGFGGGNNRAIQAVESPYVALLNTDTAVQPDWLIHLLRPMLDDERIGAATAKLLFMHDYLSLQLRCEEFSPREEMQSADERSLGVQVYGAELKCAGIEQGEQVRLLGGFFPAERDSQGRVLQWTGANAELGSQIPGQGSVGIMLELTLAAWRPDERPVRVSLSSCGRLLYAGAVGTEPKRVRIPIPYTLFQFAKPLLQSAGSSILPDGSGRDRGTRLHHGHVYSDWDGEAYSSSEEVFHFNGAACLLRRNMLDSVGRFDERFFMYYEDMDLAWRARAQGWKVWYAPQAVVRHVHSGSSGEWSPLFTFNVDLNRLLSLMKNAPWSLAQQQLARYGAETIWNAVQVLRGLVYRAGDTRGQLSRLLIRLRVWLRLLVLFPGILRSRRRIQAGRTTSESEIERWLQTSEDQVGDSAHA